MGRTVKKLSGLEIDEVSLVDRPANQHGLVAIAKRQEDDMPDIFDAEGQQVDEGELEHGDVVYDGEGNELVYIEGQDLADGDVDEDEGDDEEVGKGSFSPVQAFKNARRFGVKDTAAAYANRGKKVIENSEAGQHVKRHKVGYAAGTGAAAGAGAGYGLSKRAGESLGDAVLSELSKALTDSDRDEVIAKALDTVETIAKRNADLEETVAQLIADREAADYVELAKGYELPVEPEGLGGLLYRAAHALPEEDVRTLDRIFTAHSEVAKAAYLGGAAGADGFGESDILEQVFAIAGEAVSKSEGGLTQEAAVTALFTANPAAYDEYEAEQRFRR